jgi:hypothetical protein
MSREKARELRKAFRHNVAMLAGRYQESQSDQYPVEYRQREGAAILKELNGLEAGLSRELLLWNYAQRAEASRLRSSDPVGDAATETRRLREQMEASSLAEQYPSAVQARNILLPEARRLIETGNLERAQVYLNAAKKHGVMDGSSEREINRILDRTVPHRYKAVAIEVAAVDELELARRDIAEARVTHKLGTPVEQVRASTAMKMADFKRQQEAVVLEQQHGITLPPAHE